MDLEPFTQHKVRLSDGTLIGSLLPEDLAEDVLSWLGTLGYEEKIGLAHELLASIDNNLYGLEEITLALGKTKEKFLPKVQG